MLRGKYQQPGERARRQLPAAFPDSKPITGTGSGRLQLARQLVDPDNPLVARVIVNRIWHHLLGRGIIGSVDNFGWLGERPTHPELLDHLAYKFVAPTITRGATNLPAKYKRRRERPSD